MKSPPSYVLLLLSLSSASSAAVKTEGPRPRRLQDGMTQAQKFAAVPRPRAAPLSELKAGGSAGMTFTLGEAPATSNGGSGDGRREDRPVTAVDASEIRSKTKSENYEGKKKDRVKNEGEESNGGSIAMQMLQKLGEAKTGVGGKKEEKKKEEGRGEMEGRALASGVLGDLSD